MGHPSGGFAVRPATSRPLKSLSNRLPSGRVAPVVFRGAAGTTVPSPIAVQASRHPMAVLFPPPRASLSLSLRTSTYRLGLSCNALAVDFSPEAIAGVASSVLAVAAGAAFISRNLANEREGGAVDGSPEGMQEAARPPSPSKAVLVVGATGRLGRQVVRQCLAAGRNVVAAGRQDRAALESAMAEEGLSPAVLQGRLTAGTLFFAPNCDIHKPETLSEDVFSGVSQVVYAAGPSFRTQQEDGTMGFPPGSSPEEVDARGVAALVAAAEQYLPQAERRVESVVKMSKEADLECWQRLDDVIMGGQSSSSLSLVEGGSDGGSCFTWRGQLIMEGGGFCGARTSAGTYDFSEYDGVCLRVKASGQRFKLNMKTDDMVDVPENTYQASFDTSEDGWTTVYIPWHEFRCVKRASFDPAGPPIDPSRVSQIGLIYSRFEFNGLRNRFCSPGEFELLIDGRGICGYTEPCPQVVQISSAGVERNAYIGDDEDARSKDIPIVRLNPGGILNYKYEGELAVRASRLPFTIVRPTGLDQEDDGVGQCRVLEARQGDTISGKVSRFEVAEVVAQALGLPAAVGKTLEVRRSEAEDAKELTMSCSDIRNLFLNLHCDWDRARFGIRPFPKAVPYTPPPPTVSAAEEDEGDTDAGEGNGGEHETAEGTTAAAETDPVVVAAS